jgi:hypothetical protein
MKQYRVYFQVPALRYTIVAAKDEQDARAKAEAAAENADLDYQIDWDATEQFAFTLECE